MTALFGCFDPPVTNLVTTDVPPCDLAIKKGLKIISKLLTWTLICDWKSNSKGFSQSAYDHGSAVLSTVALQQESGGFDSSAPSVWSSHVLLVPLVASLLVLQLPPTVLQMVCAQNGCLSFYAAPQ